MAKSTTFKSDGKAKKPHPGFPLFVHRNGQWAKKVRGKLVYFGTALADPNGAAAVAKWLEQKDALLAGRKARRKSSEVTLQDLCDRFLTAKERLRDCGELSARTFAEQYWTCKRLVDWFGLDRIVDCDELTPDEFGKYRAELARTRGPVVLGNELIRVRMIFKFADDEVLIPRPIRFDQSFSKPSKRVRTCRGLSPHARAASQGNHVVTSDRSLRRHGTSQGVRLRDRSVLPPGKM